MINVCQAIQEMQKESEQDGRCQGRLMQTLETAPALAKNTKTHFLFVSIF